MAIPQIPVQGTETVTHRRRVAESINDLISFRSDDWRRISEAEKSLGITPVNLAYPPGVVDRYGRNAVPGTTDMAPAFNAAYQVASQTGCSVRWGVTAPYRLDSPINCTSMRGIVSWDESSKNSSAAVPSIIVAHTGHGFDLSASTEMVFNNVVASNLSGTVPKTLFFCARNSVGSGAGQHRFHNIHTAANCKFSNVFYWYGSEENGISDSILYNSEDGSSILNCNVTNPSSYASSFLTIATGAQSGVGYSLVNVNMFNIGDSGSNNEVCVALERSGNFNWVNGLAYCPNGLAYISIGGTTALNFLTLENIRGETDGASTTLCGIAVRCSAATGSDSCLNWKIAQFAFNTGGTGYLIDFNSTSDIVGLTMRNCYSSSGNLALVHGMAKSVIEHGSQIITGLTGGTVDGNTFVGVKSNVTLLPTATNNSGFDQSTGVIWQSDDITVLASAACTGAITSNAQWSAVRLAGRVTLFLPAVTGTASASSSFTFGQVLPSGYRPAVNQRFPCFITDNGAAVDAPGCIFINASTGDIQVLKTSSGGSNFTAGNTAGLSDATNVTWQV